MKKLSIIITHWNIPGKGQVNACWNCRGCHGLMRRKEPNNQNKIDKNRRKYMDEKEKNGDGGTDSHQ